MSASTVSITANPSTATRRRAVEKKPTDLIDTHNFSTAAAAAAAASPAADNGVLTLGDTHATTRDAVLQVRKSLPNNAVPPRRTANTARKHGSKPEKPRWKTVLSILVKNLLLVAVLLGWIFMVKELLKGKWKSPATNPLIEDNIQNMGEFVTSMKKTMKMMQVQVDVIDRKIGEEIATVKDEVNEKIERKNAELESKLTELDGRTLSLEKVAGEWGGVMEKWLTRDELNEFLEAFNQARGSEALHLDELRVFAKGIVEKEIEKHAADGLGRVDYALALGGATVVKHSEPLGRGSGSTSIWLSNHLKGKVRNDAEKMLRPSFGEPGQCFPLKGSSGFVHIRLRTAIIPKAVTLEHVAESVAYDRSSAPKHCRVSGWLQGEGQGSPDAADEDQKMILLTEFTYDLQKRNIQTFDVVESARSSIVDTVRFEFTSNHGSASHTCIYRLRVHGDEPGSVALLTNPHA